MRASLSRLLDGPMVLKQSWLTFYFAYSTMYHLPYVFYFALFVPFRSLLYYSVTSQSNSSTGCPPNCVWIRVRQFSLTGLTRRPSRRCRSHHDIMRDGRGFGSAATAPDHLEARFDSICCRSHGIKSYPKKRIAD